MATLLISFGTEGTIFDSLRKTLDSDDAGSGGIGDLLIFISTILVAGIAVSVIINTMNLVQQQAQETGVSAIKDISSGVKVISITGDRKEDGNSSKATNETLQLLKLNVKLIPGSEGIDFSKVMISVTEGTTQAELSHNLSGTTAEDADENTYVANVIMDSDRSFDRFIISPGDIIQLIISTDYSATNLALATDTSVTIQIHPNVGLSTFYKFKTPSTYTNRFVELY